MQYAKYCTANANVVVHVTLTDASWSILRGLRFFGAPAAFICLVHAMLLSGLFVEKYDWVEYFAGMQAVTNAMLEDGLCMQFTISHGTSKGLYVHGPQKGAPWDQYGAHYESRKPVWEQRGQCSVPMGKRDWRIPDPCMGPPMALPCRGPAPMGQGPIPWIPCSPYSYRDPAPILRWPFRLASLAKRG